MSCSVNGVNAIKRFKQRLYLPSNVNFEVHEFRENNLNNFINSDKFINNVTKQTKVLELYHVSREDVSHKNCSATNSIFNIGFDKKIISEGNKGRGVYFANHSRYSLDWLGWFKPVLICHVLYNEVNSNEIDRFKSEIYSPEKSSEYVIKNTDIIYPAYQLKYSVCENAYGKKLEEDTIKGIRGYVKLGSHGCKKCDNLIKPTRCDCKYESIDFDDLVNINYN